MHQHTTRLGVIVIGSNSSRMLTATLNIPLYQVVRGRRESRLFLALDREQRLSQSALDSLAEDVSALATQAREAGAEGLSLFATAALRDSGSAEAAKRVLKASTGLDLQVINGKQEAAWAFLGAAHPYFGEGAQGVVDIGGGSTEVALGDEQGPNFLMSLQMGASRLFRQAPILSPEDLPTALKQAQTTLNQGLPPLKGSPKGWLLAGGTGTALGGLITGQLNHGESPDLSFTRAQALASLKQLAALSPEQRTKLPGMTPGREHILPTGLAVLCALMEKMDILEMRITQRNNCDGFLVEQAGLRQHQP